ncbi:hypothetical protein I316_04845 [Kwoniella heveanensis BCC8398]|uniref:Centrosomin N-terminal motif 1 domain-containing protein n=1 Tax=Kwoniella heveanensis BCC8398 TaxID=1296120 RepID=A0A1B9GRD9_9TREE|nr:hypothetical protein I316_04845 [Kwoniella heveanensis BCC8398]
MAPASSLAALMASPATSGGDATVLPHGQTLPDISLGSLGSSFRSEDEDERAQQGGAAQRAPQYEEAPPGALGEPSRSKPLGLGRPQRLRARTPEISSPSQDASTPSQLPSSALLSLSPPPTVRKSSSHSALPESHAPRRPRVLKRHSSAASASSASSSDIDGPLEARYGGEDTDDEAVLASLSFAASPLKNGSGVPKREPYAGGPSRRGGRHSVAAGDVSGNGPMTLRDQEKQLEESKKEVFNLQLENHFLKERLANMAPEHIEAALKENVKLKLEILNLSKEMKKLKKLVLQQDRDLAAASRERGGADSRELERMWKDEKERRRAAEEALSREQEEGAEKLKAQLEDTEASEKVWRARAEELEEELEGVKASLDDQNEEAARLRDEADRALDEVENLKEELEKTRGLNESVGISKGREARLATKVQELEQENASLQADLSLAKKGALSEADAELLEEKLNELQDQLASAQLEVESREREIDELNNELDARLKDHEKELQQVEEEWRDEVLEARAQVDEVRDVTLLERDEELAAALEKISDLQGVQAETHDRLEETLKNIDRDNQEKDQELLAANREIEELGQRVYELEEALEDHRARESDLNADLRSADEAFENAKSQYENLVAALKEARKKLQNERDDALDRARREEEAKIAERDAARRARDGDKEVHRRALEEKDQIVSRLQAELQAARDRVVMRDRDLAEVEAALRSLEDEREKVGNEHTSDRYGLELELERVRRDLNRCEDELEAVRSELEKREEGLRSRDLELARLLDKQRDLENRLASERRGRLNMSDKLDQTNKLAKQHERDALHLRERIEELEPLLTETQQERFALQKQSESQRQERSELLLRVFKDVNRFLGSEDTTTPANFAVFRDTLLQRLRSMVQSRLDFERKIKETESSVDQRMASLKKQLDQKWRTLDQFEAAVKKLELTKLQWRTKYSLKEGELDAAKARNAELSSQLSSVKAGTTVESSSTIRSLTERAQAAEKRASTVANQLAALEARLAELQSKSGQAENKWEARVKEYENRLRIAGEKIKTEKQGGKERALQLEAQVR